MKKIIFLSICFILYSINCYSAPIISGANKNETTITVTGTGFGSKIPAAPILWDTFEDGVADTTVSGNWDAVGDWTTYTDTNVKFGGLSAVSDLSPTTTSSSAMELQNGSWSSLYFNFWHRADYGIFENNRSYPSENYKIFRVEGDNGTKIGDQSEGVPLFSYELRSPNGDNGEIQVRAQYEPVLQNGTLGQLDYAWGEAEWNNIAVHAKVDSDLTVNRNIRVWVDNIIDTNISEAQKDTHWRPWMGGDNSVFDQIRFGFFFNRNNDLDETTGSVESRFDNIYIDKTATRIEIGDNADYNSCTKRDIQIPASWSTTEVTATLNTPQFSLGETAYVFIVVEDENVGTDTASSGYEITIGDFSSSSISGAYSISGACSIS